MGEEKPKEEKKEEKKEEEAIEILLKVDMHCEACARKVARALKGFEGVEEVMADSKASKVVVKGKKADPVKVCERLQKKSGRKVELVSPLPKPPEQTTTQEPTKEEPPKPEDDKKDEPPPVVTVVLNIRMHCEACAQRLRKRIRKIKGVETVETDIGSGQVRVKGVVEPAKLVEDVYKMTRKQASIVINEEKKEEEEEEKQKKEEDNKKQEDKKEGGDKEGDNDDDKSKSFDIKRSEYWPSKNYYNYLEMYDSPHFFSDENPNACFVM